MTCNDSLRTANTCATGVGCIDFSWPDRFRFRFRFRFIRSFVRSLATRFYQEDWGGAEYWQDEHWRTALEELFYRSRNKSNEKQDDMIFFVYEKATKGKERTSAFRKKKQTDKDKAAAPVLDVTVRRYRFGVPKDLPEIKWLESVYLNILLHTVFTCTVAICSKTALERYVLRVERKKKKKKKRILTHV